MCIKLQFLFPVIYGNASVEMCPLLMGTTEEQRGTFVDTTKIICEHESNKINVSYCVEICI
jgi:hypothetical protein